MFGDSVDHRRGLFPTTEENLIVPATNIDEWIHELIVKQAAMFEVARAQQVEVNEANIANRIAERGDRELTSYALGAYVLVKYPHSTYGRGPPTKLLPFWRGPMKVERRDEDRYSLRNLVKKGKEGIEVVIFCFSFLYHFVSFYSISIYRLT
jgi:hypothetical protein